MSAQPLLVEGYASLFGVADLMGDIVHAGAFAAGSAKLFPVPMLLEHEARWPAGLWVHVEEDSRGLFVRGRIDPSMRAGLAARRRVEAGLDGLSIGFRTIKARARHGGGRDLLAVSLIEVSLVRRPMLPQARLSAGQKPSLVR